MSSKQKRTEKNKNIRLVIVVKNTLKHTITDENRTFQVKS